MSATTFSQDPYRCRLEWGRAGARRAAERGDLLVVVDTLSFSSTTVTAVQHGAIVYPCAHDEDPAMLARRVGGEVAVGRGDVPHSGRFSLSPLTYLDVAPGTRIVLRSPNGATCSRYAPQVPHLFVGALLNAAAVAAVVADMLESTEARVTLLACGERWATSGEDGALRFAIEDALGAGAILSYLPYPKSPEARVCEAAYTAMREDIGALLWECGSGRELRERGFGGDVEHAGRLNLYDAVPVMRGACIERWRG
ncbi:MAG TPA: 2-phosphosulfolactate phosphatase [Herpetosiphonaceae bacterium]